MIHYLPFDTPWLTGPIVRHTECVELEVKVLVDGSLRVASYRFATWI